MSGQMNTHADLLIEIGTEELPPKALQPLSKALATGMLKGLEQAGLTHADVTLYAAPRRLALWIKDLQTAQPARSNERRGPAARAAFDADGNATKAAQGFARSCGVNVEQLGKLETDKGSWLVYRSVEPGKQAAELVPGLLEQALKGLPIPRPMRWGSREAMFARPVHWVVLLLGDSVIDAEILSVRSGRNSYGHRFHHPAALYLETPAAYAPLLETEGHVVVDWPQRREAIRAQVVAAAASAGGEAILDEALLDEVTGLVEWPNAVLGRFDERFLAIPSEVLIATMQGHQKYFAVKACDGILLPCFITISNIDSADPAAVIEGNERVIRPRLEDAAFFWDQDRKQSLHNRLDGLKHVVFQRQLGTLYQKSERIAGLAEALAVDLGAVAGQGARAGMLSKCDLLTGVVKELPELQGTMGRYYALHDGEAEPVAAAMEQQYLPRFAGDELPDSTLGRALSIADRLDTLVGIFGIGQPPTGTRDPFALRRAALGVLRIIIEGELPVSLTALLQQAVVGYPDGTLEDGTADKVYEFMLDRLRAYYLDRSASPQEFEAVRVLRPASPLDFDQRLQAVRSFRKLEAAAALAAANKRIGNILRKNPGEVPMRVDVALFEHDAENALFAAAVAAGEDAGAMLANSDYGGVLSRLAALREPIDTFFDEVMVMAEDPGRRGNRLALLTQLRGLFLQVADVSQLQD